MKEEDRRDQSGERLIFYIQRTSEQSREHQRTENSQEHQRTIKRASEKNSQRTVKNSHQNVKEQSKTSENHQRTV